MKRANHGAIGQLENRPSEDEISLDDFVKSILLHRWKPPDEWQLVEVVNEGFTSEPPSCSPSISHISSSIQTTSIPPVDHSSIDSTKQTEFTKSFSDSLTVRQREFGIWLIQNRKLRQHSWSPLDSNHLVEGVKIPHDFQEFVSNDYLKLSTIKSLGRTKRHWSVMYRPPDLKPLFDLCKHLKGDEFSSDPDSSSVTPDCFASLWCDPVRLNQPETPDPEKNDKEFERLRKNDKKCLLQKDRGSSWETLMQLSSTKIDLKFPSPLLLEPFALLCTLLSPLSLGLGCMMFWSRAFFEYNLLASLPRLDFHQPLKKKRRGRCSSTVLTGGTNRVSKNKKTDAEDSEEEDLQPTKLTGLVLGLPRVKDKSSDDQKSLDVVGILPRALKKTINLPLPTLISTPTRQSLSPTPLFQSKKRRRSLVKVNISEDASIQPRTKVKRHSIINQSDWPNIPTERQAALAAQKKQSLPVITTATKRSKKSRKKCKKNVKKM